jgi:hypothetical protein
LKALLPTPEEIAERLTVLDEDLLRLGDGAEE